MQLEPKLYCTCNSLPILKEKALIHNGIFTTLSLTIYDQVELMLFLGKDDNNSDYEVRVYKSKPTDKYIPNKCDNVKHYEENDEFDTFIFEQFYDARQFLYTLYDRHTEYRVRPAQPINI